MANPILQKLQGNNMITNILEMAKGNPTGVYEQMLRDNPQFAQFVRENKGKSPEQIARENGLDMGLLRRFLK